MLSSIAASSVRKRSNFSANFFASHSILPSGDQTSPPPILRQPLLPGLCVTSTVLCSKSLHNIVFALSWLPGFLQNWLPDLSLSGTGRTNSLLLPCDGKCVSRPPPRTLTYFPQQRSPPRRVQLCRVKPRVNVHRIVPSSSLRRVLAASCYLPSDQQKHSLLEVVEILPPLSKE